MKKSRKFIRDDLFSFYAGLALFVVFFLLWFLTLPDQVVERDYNNLTDEEKFELVQNYETATNNEYYLITASVENNNHYCQFITDEDLKKECYDSVTNYFDPLVE